MKLCYVILLALFTWMDSYSQAKKAVASHSHDTVYLRKVLDSAKNLRFKDTAAHTAIADRAITLSEKVNDKKFMALAHMERSIHLTNEKAIKGFATALVYAKESQDTMTIVQANISIGHRYSIMDQRLKSLDYFFETLRLLNKNRECREYELALSHIGNTYMEFGDRRGLEYQQQCFDLVAKRVSNDSVKLNIHLLNLGLAYYRFGDTVKAIDLTERSLSVCRELTTGSAILPGSSSNGCLTVILKRILQALS